MMAIKYTVPRTLSPELPELPNILSPELPELVRILVTGPDILKMVLTLEEDCKTR